MSPATDDGRAREARPSLRMLFEGRPPAVTVAVALALLAVVAILDLVTGPELGFSLFYLLPIGVVAFFIGRGAGFALSVVSAATWLLIDLSGAAAASLFVPLWNSGIRLGIFAVVTWTLSDLRRLLDSERRLARTDQLTGTHNARAFYDLIELEMSRSLRYSRPFTLTYLDIDNFKAVNDALGHAAGDRLLRGVADTLRENVRAMDSVARLGGDEFALLLPETGPDAAETALRKVHTRLAETVRRLDLPVSFSMGAVVCIGPPSTVDELIRHADHEMYRVKKGGKAEISIATLDARSGIEAILQRNRGR